MTPGHISHICGNWKHKPNPHGAAHGAKFGRVKYWEIIAVELPDEILLVKVLGTHWWFRFGKALCEVIMPEDFYKLGPPTNRQFDDIGGALH